MPNSSTMAGVLAPVVTPFDEDLSPDADRLIRHCRWLLTQNCGLAIFGTNSEANSLSVQERMDLLDSLVEAGLPAEQMMPGTGCCAIIDSVSLTKHAVSQGVGGVLMLPPFYYKNVSDAGIFRNFAEIIERVGDSRLKIYLYHFPQMSQVPFGLDLISKLLNDYPDTVVGIKDSSGDQANLEAMLKAFPGFGVFAGNETLLLANMRAGGVGCISATANINPAAIHDLYVGWEDASADDLQAELTDLRMAVQQFPIIAALKWTIAHHMAEPSWSQTRPPLIPLDERTGNQLIQDLDSRGFRMPGIRQSTAGPVLA